MATSTKTICYAFPVGASAANNTLTTLPQITVYIPESSVNIISAWVDVTMDDITSVSTGSITTRTVELQLGSSGFNSTTDSNTLTNSGENLSICSTRDFTSYFQTNWAGPSMTCDLSVLTNQTTGSPTGMVNVCAILYVTYDYDDTSATHIKSAWIPLNMPAGPLPTTKTSHDTIPALDTYLPEDSKTYRNIYIVTRGNRNHPSASDITVTYELSSLSTHQTQPYEGNFSSAVYSRYVWDITSYITTNTTHTFNVWANVASRFSCMQAWMVVTYEFDPINTTQSLNSIVLPARFDSPMGGLTVNDYQRSIVDFWMPEDNSTIQRIACFLNWGNFTIESGLNGRIGTGSFISYNTSSGSAAVCGDHTMMIRDDSPSGITLQKGRNRLNVDVYNTSNVQRGLNVGCFWIINYLSDVSVNGISTNNKTILWLCSASANFNNELIHSANSLSIAEPDYFVSNVGYDFKYINNGAEISRGIAIGVERLVGENGLKWESIYADAGGHDVEVGVNNKYSDATSIFRRWTSDIDTSRLDLSVSRRYRTWVAGLATNPAIHDSLTGMTTYHSVIRSVTGSITGSSGGLVDIYLHRASDGEIVLATSQTGNGAFSFNWFDDTEAVFVTAYESTTKKGMSKKDTAGSGFDVSLSSSSGGGEFSPTWFS